MSEAASERAEHTRPPQIAAVEALPPAPRPAGPVEHGRHRAPGVKVTRWLAPLVAGTATAIAEGGAAGWPGDALLVLAVFAGAVLLTPRTKSWARLLPLVGAFVRRAAPAAAVLVLLGLHLTNVDVPKPLVIAIAGLAAVLVAELAERMSTRARAHGPRTRVAIIGSSRSADALERELRLAANSEYRVVGRVALPGEGPNADGIDVPTLGPLDDLGSIVENHRVGLLLLTGNAPRMAVFDEIASSCLELPVRLRELAGFYEESFGHVPVAEINAAWFQYMMHPSYNAGSSWLRRVVDVVIAAGLAVAFSPVLAVSALLIRRDGGPVFFRQVRIGEGGRPFSIIKLRTMRVGAANAWTEEDDPRITRVGQFLRKTHLDELPQVLNILRGEMSVVGPRPEQPEFVDRLEQIVPFYQRRHLVKPGLTGWAQVRCGYAGSDVGSAWKVCHDLYYLKHRSLLLDILIVGETLRTVVADRQYTAEPLSVAFILAGADIEPARAGA